MFKTITIENFRGLQYFNLKEVGRINLLVGENNSGKTSILEAIELLCSENKIETLDKVMSSRGEYLEAEDTRIKDREQIFDVRHLFWGHEVEPSRYFSISGRNENHLEMLVGAIQNKGEVSTYLTNDKNGIYSDKNHEGSSDALIDDFNEIEFVIEWKRGEEVHKIKIPLVLSVGLPAYYSRYASSSRRLRDVGSSKRIRYRTQFVTSSSFTPKKMIELFEQLVLTPEEKLVQEALQIVEPRIERIASISSPIYRRADSRGGFMVRLSDSDRRVPIGSMGDGIWRILGLALATVCAGGGVLLVDEIDTGLHFTAMSDMWKLIWETAKRLDVQVFATTHSSDCWTSLASVASQEEAVEDGIRIHRIERGKETGVVFSDREIVVAAQRGFEVR